MGKMNEAGSWEQGEARWFSAALRFLFINSSLGQTMAEDSIYLVTASDFDEAFNKFVAIGKHRELSYYNYK